MAANGADVKQLQLQISASTELLIRNLKTAENAVSTFRRDTETGLTRIDQRFGALGRPLETSIARVKTAASAVLPVLGSLATVAGARQFLALADASKQLDAQLALATRGFGSFTQAQADAQRLASETRNDLGATVSLYGNFIRASQQMGRGQDDAARATETFSKALKIGGADANAAASATLQFGQALASGALRGDEFNSIAEASPRILKLLADAMGVPQGQMRALAAEGKLTADVLYRALTDTRFTAGIDEEFRTLPVTFDEAMTQIHNAAVITFGGFDRGGGFSTLLANFVLGGAAGFADLASAPEDFGIEVRGDLEGLADAFDPLIRSGRDAFASIGFEAESARQTISKLLHQVDDYVDALNAIDREADRLTFGIFGLSRNTPAGPSDIGGRFDRRAAASDRERRAEIEARRADTPAAPLPPAARSAATATGGRLVRLRPQADAARKALDDLMPKLTEVNRALNDIEIGGGARAIGGRARSLYEGLGVSSDVGGITAEIDAKRDAQDRLNEVERQAQEDLRQQGLARVDDLAFRFQDAFGNGTRSIWDRFRSIGIATVAQVAARLATNNAGAGGGLGAILSASIGAITNGRAFANGGSPPVGLASLVGERGPEIFVPRVPGTIIPNSAIGMAGAGRQQVDVAVDVKPSPLFDTRVQGVTLRTVGAAAEPIMAGAEARTMRKLNRGGMPGGYG